MPSLLGWIHLGGIVAAWFVLYSRSGLRDVKARHGVDWREFLLPNIPYFLLMWAKCLVWEVVLIVWLATGRPESPWRAAVEIDGRPARTLVRR